MKSLLMKSGVTRNLLVLAGLCVGVKVLISLLEEVVLLFVYYFA